MSLVLAGAPVVLEPVDQVLERSVALVVEVEAFRPDFDELFDNFLTRNVRKHDVLRVLRQNRETVRNALRLLFLLFSHSFLELFISLSVQKLGVAGHFADKTVAWDDVALDDFTQVVERVVADQQAFTNGCTLWLVLLSDVDVHKMLLEELPS